MEVFVFFFFYSKLFLENYSMDMKVFYKFILITHNYTIIIQGL